MKFSILSLLSIATLAVSTKYDAGYDKLPRGPLKNKVFRGLSYSDEWAVGRANIQISNIAKQHKTPQVLFSGPAEVNKTFGTITRADKGNFDATSVQVACSGPKGKNGRKTSVPCSVIIEGKRRNLAGVDAPPVTVDYKQTSQMKQVNLKDLSSIRSLRFTVTKAGKDGKLKDGVTLVLDSLRYEITENESGEA